MATQLIRSKGGLRLEFRVSTRGKPRIRQAYPIPDFPDANSSMLALALETVIQTGRKGIRVTSTPDVLPGGADAAWSLFHAAYQGTAPATLSYEEIQVQAPKVNLLIDPALPKATHKFYLQRVEAGKTYTYSEASIATPDDALAPLSLEGILADDMITASEKAAFKSYYDAILAEQAGYDAQADQWLVSRTAYDSAITALTTAVTALSPAYTNLAVDTSTGGAGSGATLLALFRAVYDARTALLAAISAAQGNGAGDPFADDKLTPAEKYTVKRWYDDIVDEQAGLDSAADTAGVSRTAYDTAVTNLITAMNGLTGTGGWDSGTHDWTNYTTTYSLGVGGGATLRSKYTAVYSARTALRNAVLQASLASNAATDTFRPLRTWDFSDRDPMGWVPGSITVAAAASPSDKTARKWTTTTSGVLGKFTGEPNLTDASSGSPVAVAFSFAGKDCYILQARVRLVSGTWAGKAYYSTDGTTFTQNCSIAAPTTGAWQIVTWDLRNCSSTIANQAVVKGFALELAGSGTSVIEVDYVSVGIYGHGSAAEYDLALQAAVSDLLARGNVTTFANLIVGNVTNLFPNPNSEVLPVSAGGTLPDSAIGAVGIPNSYTGNQYAGARCREISSTTAVTVTPRYSGTAGDVYYFEAQIAGYSPGTPTVTLRPYNSSGGALTTQTLTGATGSYALKAAQFTLPAGTYSFDLAFHNAGGDGVAKALFDNIILRKAADGQLLVPGTVQAKHVVAGAIQTYQLSVGPMLQFRANSGGLALVGRPDGSLTRATSSELTGPPALPPENSADPAVYMDDSRSYPSGDVKTFEAQWGGTTEDRGIVLNMGTAFATSGQTGLLVIWSGTSLKVCGCTGIGKYPTNTTKTALTNGTATVPTTSSADDKLTVIYYNALVPPASGGTANIRLRVLINGVSVLTMTDSDLGSYGGASQGGYAGVYLAGNVRMFMPRFGRGFVTIQDGVITADKIAAGAIIAEKIAAGAIIAEKLSAGVIQTSDYAEDGSGNPTAGAKIFNNTTAGGVGGKFGPNGLQVGNAIMNQASLRVNRVHNADFSDYFLARYVTTDYQMPFAWTTNPTDYSMSWSTADGSSTPYGSAIGARVTAAPSTTQTKGVAIRQVFDIPNVPPSTVFQAHLKWKLGLVKEHADITACSYRVKTYLYAPDGTSYLIDDTTISTADTGYGSGVTWTSKDYNIDTYLQAKGAGRWTLLFDSTSFGNGLSATNGSASTSRWVTGHIGRVELMT